MEEEAFQYSQHMIPIRNHQRRKCRPFFENKRYRRRETRNESTIYQTSMSRNSMSSKAWMRMKSPFLILSERLPRSLGDSRLAEPERIRARRGHQGITLLGLLVGGIS